MEAYWVARALESWATLQPCPNARKMEWADEKVPLSVVDVNNNLQYLVFWLL
jgi:hypothetical protein